MTMMTPRSEAQKASIKSLFEKKRAILSDDCGGGKTFIALYAAKQTGLPVTVICPAAVKPHWAEIAQKLGIAPQIVSFNKCFDEFPTFKFGTLIVDECHKGIGQKEYRKSKCLKAIVDSAELSRYVFLLSATPSQHRPLEFYWLLKLCKMYSPGRAEFRKRYCGAYYDNRLRDCYGNPVLKDGPNTNTDELIKRFNFVNVRNFKKPVKIHITKIIGPPTGHEYPRFSKVAEWRAEVGRIKLEGFKKYIKAKNLLKKEAIFFTHHREITIELARFLGCDAVLGGQSEKIRKKIWKRLDKQKNIVVSLKAGGEGINELGSFSRAFFVESSYSPLIDKQAILRMSRGLDYKELYVSYFLTKDEHTYMCSENKEPYLNLTQEGL